MMRDSPSGLDTDLLRGFSYACRPDCGLCCYAEPRVAPEERGPLLAIAPSVEIHRAGGIDVLTSRPDGGACQLLSGNRCRGHDARPSPCREFPISVHVGGRLQASLVLSCPGIALAGLAGSLPRSRRDPPRGFDSELASVQGRAARYSAREIEFSARRRRRIVSALDREGRWEDEEGLRSRLRRNLPFPSSEDFPAPDPPSAEEGIEFLPLFFDRRAGPVALAAGVGGWELLELAPTGGARAHLGLVPPPGAPPPLGDAARTLLQNYLAYHLERDAFLAAVAWEMVESDEGTLAEWVAGALRTLGATVLSRAVIRAKIGRDLVGPLTEDDVADGIRATDQDELDRPTWGARL